MYRYLGLLLGLIFSGISGFSQKAEVVFCADMSGSTNGMVTSLQKTIWSLMNEMDANESLEEVKFGFVGYGRKSFGKENYYSKVLHDLNPDVNQIGYTLVKSQVLIQGCDAYPQKALNDAIEGISWSKEENVEKIVIVIGNGGIPHKQMCKEVKRAKKKGISVTPVFYNTPNRKAEENAWKSFAKECNKELRVAIPAKRNVVFKKSYDSQFLIDAGERLLGTYIPYGEEGKKELKKLTYMFNNLKENSMENFEEMLVHQSSYHVQGKNSEWDLIDLSAKEEIDFSKIDKERLPVFLQSFNEDQLAKYVQIKTRERKLMVKKIRLELEKRQAYAKRKQIKSQHFAGKGGLSNILQVYLNEKFSDLQLTSDASSN